jgi:molybdopterin/thiamine biosynthesis adenylyltransferase
VSARGTKSAAVVGAGGNIGSHLVPHLGRMPAIGRVILVDRDAYEAKNVESQAVVQDDVGRPKVDVQAGRLRRIRETLDVETFGAAVEAVPLGALRADVILACVDSRVARLAINEIAWRLGIPWIDAGVRADGLLARIDVHVPGREQPCFECPLDDGDYATLEEAHPCTGDPVTSPTNAPSALGALAAALQALECQKALTGEASALTGGRQVTIGALTHRHYVTTFRRNPHCRFDHDTWSIEPIGASPDRLTLIDAYRLAGASADGDAEMRVAGQRLVRVLTCPSCGSTRDVGLRLFRRLSGPERSCQRCGSAMRAGGFDVHEWLGAAAIPPGLGDVPLRSIGVGDGDVLSIRTSDGTEHYQIGGLR